MSKRIKLASHLTRVELKQRYLKSRDPVESRRWHLLWLVSEGHYLCEATAVVGVSYIYGRKVVRAFNHEGIEAMANGRRHRVIGRRMLLDAEAQHELTQALDKPPADGGLWTGPKVAAWIAEKTGRTFVRPQRGWDYLQRLGYSSQRPRPRHLKADVEAQATFKKTGQSRLSS